MIDGKKLNRDTVAQDHLKIGPSPRKFQTIAHAATEVLNISCTKLIAGPQEFFLGY